MRTKLVLIVLLARCLFPPVHAAAQVAGTNSPPAGKDGLLLVAPTHDEPLRLTVDDLKTMKHLTVKVHNPHTDRDETYDGVRLADLLAKVGTPLSAQLRGKALSHYIVATGSDGYITVLAPAEVDPEFHPGEVLVADAMDRKPLDAHSGPLKLVVTDDRHPARSVRNLVRVEVRVAP